jgi:hypothetical protein
VSDLCKWLHEQLGELPLITYPFSLNCLPENGIYFFFQEGEAWGHIGGDPRIVRAGTHRGQGNLRSRISETFLLDERRLGFSDKNAKPADRSIFRKNLGRALLNRSGDDYLGIWEIDFIPRANRDQHGHQRDIAKERGVENDISRLLRETFSLRAIAVDDTAERNQLEKRLIGTLANCKFCRPSDDWLGRHSPEPKIATGNLWQVQHVSAHPLGAREREAIVRAIRMTESQRAARKKRRGS